MAIYKNTPPIVTNGLILHLDAGSRQSYVSGSTTWTDLSGNGNTGTLTNGPTFNSLNQGSIAFDAIDDKVTMTAGSNFAYGTGDFSVEGWFYQTSVTSSFGDRIWCQTVSGTNYFIVQAGTDVASNSQPQIVFTFATSGGGTGIVSPIVYPLNQWNHFCVSRISNVVSIYMNSIFSISAACTQDFSNITYVPTIGQFTHTNSNGFHGRIALIRVYKGVGLTAAQVAQNYNALKSRFGLT